MAREFRMTVAATMPSGLSEEAAALTQWAKIVDEFKASAIALAPGAVITTGVVVPKAKVVKAPEPEQPPAEVETLPLRAHRAA